MTESTASAGQRLVRLEGFEPAVPLSDSEREDFLRRYSILLVDEVTSRRGGLGSIVRASTTSGDTVAVKQLQPACSQEANSALEVAFQAEYDAHRALSSLRGIPALYGRAALEGQPVMVMEWVPGITLEEAARLLAVDDAGRVAPLVAARIGRDVYDVLASMEYLGSELIHRDLSLRNIMIDTSRLSLQEQVEQGTFEVRLVDFGSAAVRGNDDPSVTARLGTWRGATADFAAPEMLTEDVAAVEELRHSAAVDVYAAASVLYALMEGRPPFDLSPAGRAARATGSAYRIKTEFDPKPAQGAHGGSGDLSAVLAREPEVAVVVGRAAASSDEPPSADRLRAALTQVDAQIEVLIASCLQPDQQARPSAAAMRDALAAFCSNYTDNIERALRGEELLACASGLDTRDRRSRRHRARRVARVCLDAVVIAVWLATALFTGLLVNGVPAGFSIGGQLHEGSAPGAAVAMALLLPGVLGLLLRGRHGAAVGGMTRALLGDAAGCVLVGLMLFVVTWPNSGVVGALSAALFLATASPAAVFVFDWLLAVPAAPIPPVVPDAPEATETPASEVSPGTAPELSRTGFAPDASAPVSLCKPVFDPLEEHS